MGARKTKISTATATVNPTAPGEALPPGDPLHVPGDGLAIVMSRKALRALVQQFMGVVDKRSTMPILAHVTMLATAAGLLVTGTDLNVSLRVLVACKVYRTGGISLNAKNLLDIVKSLPDGDVTIAIDKRFATFTCGAARVTLEGMPDRDAPKFPEFKDATWSRVDATELAGIMGAVEHAICRDETRFHLNGIYIEATDAVLRAVATDGHRLAKAETWSDSSLRSKGAIVPRKGAVEAIRMMSAKGVTACDVAITKTHAWWKVGEATLVVKLIDAQFPPYEQVIPRDHPTTVTVDREALVGAVTRAKVNCSETRGIALTLASGKLVVSSSDPDRGETKESLDATIDGKPGTIGVNATYLLGALGEIDAAVDAVTIQMGDQLDPMLVRSLDDYAMAEMRDARLLVVIMPMRI